MLGGILNLFGLGPSRTGRVESWVSCINGNWYSQMALVDDTTNNEIISPINTRTYEEKPANGTPLARIDFKEGKLFLIKEGAVENDY